MLDNNTYNLVKQLEEESQSLWKIKNTYRKDVSHCDECNRMWDKLEKQKEDNVRELQQLVKNHM